MMKTVLHSLVTLVTLVTLVFNCFNMLNLTMHSNIFNIMYTVSTGHDIFLDTIILNYILCNIL